jgi:hypothetical protein
MCALNNKSKSFKEKPIAALKAEYYRETENFANEVLKSRRERRDKDAERHRQYYQKESAIQREKRRQKDALRHRMAYQEKKL